MGLIRVHESFRIIAIAYPPSIENPWLTAEVLPMFHVHHLEPLQVHERVRGCSHVARLRSCVDSCISLSLSLSLSLS